MNQLENKALDIQPKELAHWSPAGYNPWGDRV